MKQYKVWIHVEEYDTDTEKYNDSVAEPLSVGEDIIFPNIGTAVAVQEAVKIAGEVALTLPQIYMSELTDTKPIAGMPIGTVFIPMGKAVIPKYKEQNDATEEVPS